jgi:hypothetical protein
MTRRLADRYSFSIDAGYAWRCQTGLTDINLDTVRSSTLSNEANRPVYAPASAIVPRPALSPFSDRDSIRSSVLSTRSHRI